MESVIIRHIVCTHRPTSFSHRSVRDNAASRQQQAHYERFCLNPQQQNEAHLSYNWPFSAQILKINPEYSANICLKNTMYELCLCRPLHVVLKFGSELIG